MTLPRMHNDLITRTQMVHINDLVDELVVHRSGVTPSLFGKDFQGVEDHILNYEVSAYPATSSSSRLRKDVGVNPESIASTSRSLSFAPSIRVDEPIDSIVARTRSLESVSAGRMLSPFQ